MYGGVRGVGGGSGGHGKTGPKTIAYSKFPVRGKRKCKGCYIEKVMKNFPELIKDRSPQTPNSQQSLGRKSKKYLYLITPWEN